MKYSQDVFGCLPVADIVKRRTAKFLKKYKEANVVCQASDIDCQVTTAID